MPRHREPGRFNHRDLWRAFRRGPEGPTRGPRRIVADPHRTAPRFSVFSRVSSCFPSGRSSRSGPDPDARRSAARSPLGGVTPPADAPARGHGESRGDSALARPHRPDRGAATDQRRCVPPARARASQSSSHRGHPTIVHLPGHSPTRTRTAASSTWSTSDRSRTLTPPPTASSRIRMPSPDSDPMTRACPGASGSWTIMSRPPCRASWGLEPSGGGTPTIGPRGLLKSVHPRCSSSPARRNRKSRAARMVVDTARTR
jgi:hypothetical protein